MTGAAPSAPDLGSRHIIAEVRGRTLHLRIDRAERRNAFAQEMYRALKRAAIWADGQPELDSVCVTGTDRWFAAGGDMGGNSQDSEGLEVEWDATDNFPFRHIERCRKIWVAAINGTCHAGGIVLALHCDVVLASDRARFRVPELLRGIPDPFMAARLAEAVGIVRARWLFFTAAEIDAERAAEMGLIGEVVPHDDLAERTEWVLAQISATGPEARAAIKRDLNARLPQHDTGMFHRSMMSPEMMEGMRAFIEKRPAEWPRG
jgi:enoyl-CoA hydratase/carnithine racemase